MQKAIFTSFERFMSIICKHTYMYVYIEGICINVCIMYIYVTQFNGNHRIFIIMRLDKKTFNVYVTLHYRRIYFYFSNVLKEVYYPHLCVKQFLFT